jgi:hypothetical protein
VNRLGDTGSIGVDAADLQLVLAFCNGCADIALYLCRIVDGWLLTDMRWWIMAGCAILRKRRRVF